MADKHATSIGDGVFDITVEPAVARANARVSQTGSVDSAPTHPPARPNNNMGYQSKQWSIFPILTLGTILGLSGIGYQAVSAELNRDPNHVPLRPGTLAAIPLLIADWTGEDLPLEESIIRRTDTDDHISRRYWRQNGEGVAIFVGYGVRARDLQPHRPDICYPSAGWTLNSTEMARIPLSSGSSLPCKLYHFSRGGFDTRQLTVLGYYIVDGQYCEDVSLLRSKAWRGAAGLRYVAQVQISGSDDGFGNVSRVIESVKGFAATTASEIRARMPETGNDVAAH